MERQVRGQYTADYKAQAVSLAQTLGATRAARKLGISVKTLANWIRLARDGEAQKSGKRRLSEVRVPGVHRRLARDEGRAGIDAVVEDFQQVRAILGRERGEAP